MNQSSRVAAIAVCVAALASAGGAEKRAFSIGDHYRVVGVADPQVSPEGDRVAFTITQTDLERAAKWSHIWVCRIDGSAIRQLTPGGVP